MAAVACGTGGTLAEARRRAGSRAAGTGRAGGRRGFLAGEVARLQREAFGGPAGDWSLEERFTFGGYARTTPELNAFADGFEERHGLPVERVYVAKLLYALAALAGEGAFARGSRVAAVITGAPDAPPQQPSVSR